MKRILLLLVAVTSLAASAAAPAAASNEPVRMSFDKSLVGPGWVWEGTVGGDISGTITTTLTGLRIAGPIWHVRFEFAIDAGAHSFTTELAGILNTNTGAVVMNGTVVDGYLEGAQVHEQAQLVDPNPSTLRFQGSIQLMPATAR